MPSEHDQLVNVLIDADTVVVSIALVTGAVGRRLRAAEGE